MEAGQVQGVPAPLITVQTPVEKVRTIRIPKIQYRVIRSFVESSLKQYAWRVGYEYPDRFEWRKEGKWMLTVFKYMKPVEVESLPVRGIYRVVSSVTPFAVLSSLGRSIDFVVVNGEAGILYYHGRVMLAFTRDAPVAFAPIVPVPFSRLIPVYEVLDVLKHYVSF
jgi:hypothetical protein